MSIVANTWYGHLPSFSSDADIGRSLFYPRLDLRNPFANIAIHFGESITEGGAIVPAAIKPCYDVWDDGDAFSYKDLQMLELSTIVKPC